MFYFHVNKRRFLWQIMAAGFLFQSQAYSKNIEQNVGSAQLSIGASGYCSGGTTSGALSDFFARVLPRTGSINICNSGVVTVYNIQATMVSTCPYSGGDPFCPNPPLSPFPGTLEQFYQDAPGSCPVLLPGQTCTITFSSTGSIGDPANNYGGTLFIQGRDQAGRLSSPLSATFIFS